MRPGNVPEQRPNLVAAKFRVLRFWHRWVTFAGQTVFCGPLFTTSGHVSAHADSRTKGNEDRREDGYEEGITPYECSTEYRSCARRVG
jgi:hypothetical protein